MKRSYQIFCQRGQARGRGLEPMQRRGRDTTVNPCRSCLLARRLIHRGPPLKQHVHRPVGRERRTEGARAARKTRKRNAEAQIGARVTQRGAIFSTTNSTQLQAGAPPKFLTSNTHGEEGRCEQQRLGWRDARMDASNGNEDTRAQRVTG